MFLMCYPKITSLLDIPSFFALYIKTSKSKVDGISINLQFTKTFINLWHIRSLNILVGLVVTCARNSS